MALSASWHICQGKSVTGAFLLLIKNILLLVKLLLPQGTSSSLLVHIWYDQQAVFPHQKLLAPLCTSNNCSPVDYDHSLYSLTVQKVIFLFFSTPTFFFFWLPLDEIPSSVPNTILLMICKIAKESQKATCYVALSHILGTFLLVLTW